LERLDIRLKEALKDKIYVHDVYKDDHIASGKVFSAVQAADWVWRVALHTEHSTREYGAGADSCVCSAVLLCRVELTRDAPPKLEDPRRTCSMPHGMGWMRKLRL